MAAPARTPLQQTFFSFTIAVKTTPTPVSPLLDISSMIQSFEIGNPSVNANSVFYGDSGVTASSAGPVVGTGIEIGTGASKAFVIRQERMIYEVQNPTLLIAQKELCQSLTPDMIPLIVWKLNDFWLVATVNTTVSCIAYRSVFI